MNASESTGSWSVLWRFPLALLALLGALVLGCAALLLGKSARGLNDTTDRLTAFAERIMP